MTEWLSQPVASLPSQPGNDIERRALTALHWMDKAFMADDDLVASLYRFFALEALLGEASEGLKADALAFREMMLSHLTTAGFRDPSVTRSRYVKVRNAAVHGEELPEVTPEVATHVESAVRDALSQYLDLAKEHELAERKRLRRFLDEHPDRPALIRWLRENGRPEWDRYLARLEWPQNGC
jgi:hypothetical protein